MQRRLAQPAPVTAEMHRREYHDACDADDAVCSRASFLTAALRLDGPRHCCSNAESNKLRGILPIMPKKLQYLYGTSQRPDRCSHVAVWRC
jgi:hypothetical protein